MLKYYEKLKLTAKKGFNVIFNVNRTYMLNNC